MVFENIKDCSTEERDKLLSISEIFTRRNKLKQGRFRLNYLTRLSVLFWTVLLWETGSTLAGC